QQAEQLRTAILKDATASPSLLTLAADADGWDKLYLAGLEQAGLLRPDDALPPIRQDPLVISLTATLASGILAGPAGRQIITTGNLTDFFDHVRPWYGNDPKLLAPPDPNAPKFTSDSHGINGVLANLNPVPALANFSDYNL